MRLDLFLKISRLVSRRSLAQEFCEKGHVTVNGSAAKPSKEVKVGDEIEITRRNRRGRFAVLRLPDSKQVSKNSAGELYSVIEDIAIEDDLF